MDTRQNKDLSWVWLLAIIMITLMARVTLELERDKRHEAEMINEILMENISYMQDEIERLRALVN